MLRWLIQRKLKAEERKLGAPLDYLQHIAAVSTGAFFRFASIMPLASYRKVLPPDAWFTARIVTLQHDDCGSCLQGAVNMARQARVPASTLQAVLDGNEEGMSPELRDVWAFAQAVLAGTLEAERLREVLRERYGDRGLIELAYVIASSRIPPVVKRTLGYAQSCQAVKIAPDQSGAD